MKRFPYSDCSVSSQSSTKRKRHSNILRHTNISRSRFHALDHDAPLILPPGEDNRHLSINHPPVAANLTSATSAFQLGTESTISESPSATNREATSRAQPSYIMPMTFCGEEFEYDLRALEQDPLAITALLKATFSEQGRWITVGAHYRRSGNLDAAVSVMEHMIAFMAEQGVAEDKLRPAYLLLSACESDLAKRAKSSQPSQAHVHYRRSSEWLQKVYGSLETETKYSAYERASKVDSVLHLQDRIQNLVEERDQKTALLASLQSAQRRLEENIGREREGRQKLLESYSKLQKELSTARKVGESALNQIKREVEKRRRVETQMCVEKDMRLKRTV